MKAKSEPGVDGSAYAAGWRRVAPGGVLPPALATTKGFP